MPKPRNTANHCYESDCRDPVECMCEGCSRKFCDNHFREHKRFIERQQDEARTKIDRIQEKLNRQKHEQHPCIKKINDWEGYAINKIQKIAREKREYVKLLLKEQYDQVADKLSRISRRIRDADDNKVEIEKNIDNWLKKLNELKSLLTSDTYFQVIVNPKIIIEDDSRICVEKVLVVQTPSEYFKTPTLGIELKNYKTEAVKNGNEEHASIRGGRKYSSGLNQIRFQVQLSRKKDWVYVGIVSEQATVQFNAYTTPTTYGWSTPTMVFANAARVGKEQQNLFDDIEDCSFLLTIDCEHDWIQLQNEKTNEKHKIKIDTNLCPKPWLINMGLYYPGDKITLLDFTQDCS